MGPIHFLLLPSALRRALSGWACRKSTMSQRQSEAPPHVDKRLDERVDQPVIVVGRGRDAQSLGALGHRRIVDRLDVDAVLFQKEACLHSSGSPTNSGTMWGRPRGSP